MGKLSRLLLSFREMKWWWNDDLLIWKTQTCCFPLIIRFLSVLFKPLIKFIFLPGRWRNSILQKNNFILFYACLNSGKGKWTKKDKNEFSQTLRRRVVVVDLVWFLLFVFKVRQTEGEIKRHTTETHFSNVLNTLPNHSACG
jgi:hypothetical protein